MKSEKNNFRSLLQPNLSILHADGRIQRLTGSNIREWVFGEILVISRALCYVDHLPRPAGPISDKAQQAIELAARVNTPYADPEFYFIWMKDSVAAWSWSREEVMSLHKKPRQRIIPESLFHAPARGVVLHQCLDGYEAQIWEDDALIHSRWWPDFPEADEWNFFLRASRVQDSPPLPSDPVLPVWRSIPQSSRERVATRLKKLSYIDLLSIVLLIFIAPAGFLGAQFFSTHLQGGIYAAQLDQLREETAMLDRERRKAQRAANTLLNYQQALQSPHPLFPLADLSEGGAEFDLEFERLRFVDARLEAVYRKGDDVQPDKLVERLEDMSTIRNVSIASNRRPGQWVIEADIVRYPEMESNDDK